MLSFGTDKAQILSRIKKRDPKEMHGWVFVPGQIASEQDVQAVVDACKDNPFFRSLSIQGSYGKRSLTNKDVELLTQCRHLTFLDISNNADITAGCVQALADHLALETVFIRGCGITHPGELLPFLENDIILDLRIALTSAVTEGPQIKAKLAENKARQDKLRQEIRLLQAEDVNFVLTEVIKENPAVMERFHKSLQDIVQKDYKTWKDPIVTGQMLAFNMSKLLFKETRLAAKLGVILWEKYRALREEAVKLMQFPPAPSAEQSKKAKTDEPTESESYVTRVFRYLDRKDK